MYFNWLRALKKTDLRRRAARRIFGDTLQELEIRTLLSALTFVEQTGAANPLNGVDLGAASTTSMGDLDGDGDLDLIAGEVNGTFKYYRNTGTAMSPVFTEQNGYNNPLFVFDVGDFSSLTLGDLDGDGDLDLIVGASNGTLKYFRNTRTATEPSFYEQTGSDNPVNGVDVGDFSSPTLGDLDGDGDLDLVVGKEDGTFRYYRNTGKATVPGFSYETGVNNPLNGIDVNGGAVFGYSTPTLRDLDGDGDLDLIAGMDDGTFKYYRNTGTAKAPIFTEQTGGNNPLNGFDVGAYSTPTLGDLDGDGDLDLLSGEDEGVFNYFLNTTMPVDDLGFTEQTSAHNPLNSFDVGSSSAPSLGDLDGDGDLDLVVGKSDGTFAYYLNSGIALNPVFTEQTGNANPLIGFDVGGVSAPTLADLDSDGDLDLIAGEYYGTFRYYKNVGTAIAPFFVDFTLIANPLNGVDVGDLSTPTLGDLDGDGDLDLISREYYGYFKYYKNIGTAIAPVFFEQTGANNPLNGVDFGDSPAPTLADLDGDGDLDLIAGGYFGNYKYYKNTGTALSPIFAEQTGAANPLNSFDVGYQASPTLGDLDGDGDLDLIAGEGGGTFRYYLDNVLPTDIILSNNSVPENTSSGTVLGQFSSNDLNEQDTFTYALVAGSGDIDNASFTIVGNELQTSAVFDFEVKSSYSIRVRTTDSAIGTFDKVFTINVTDVNETPTDLSLSNSSVAENSGVGTVVGMFDTTDPDSGNTFTYNLVSGTGSTDNALFAIVGNELRTSASFDFEVKNSYSIRVQTTDQGDLSFEKVFTINVTDMNEPPTNISLSNNSVAENRPSGTTVGEFSTADPDSGDTFTYSLVTGAGDTDNAYFTIVGDELQTATILNFEVQNSYSIRVRTTDQGNITFEKVFTINVTDLNDAPVLKAGFFPQLPDWWRKSKTNAGDTVANVIDSVSPEELITDEDSGAQKGFAVIDAANLNGTWQYSTDDGVIWNSLADASTTNARLLNEAAKLRFVPFKKKFRGDVQLTVVAWDQTTGTNGGTADVTVRGDATAFSPETSLVTQTVLKKKPKS